MSALTPRQALETPELRLIDIRPLAERYGGMGFVPGSLCVPLGPAHGEHRAAVLAAAAGQTPVLVCLSGGRARESAQDQTVPYLEGGTLGWSAAGFPLAGCKLGPVSNAVQLADFPRFMASCFVGQLVEISLDREATGAPSLDDPMNMLEQCFASAGTSFDEPTPAGVLQALDLAAIASLRMGTPLEVVTRNLDHMLDRLPPSSRALVA